MKAIKKICKNCKFWDWFESHPELIEYELGYCFNDKSGKETSYINDSCEFWEGK